MKAQNLLAVADDAISKCNNFIQMMEPKKLNLDHDNLGMLSVGHRG